MFSATLFILNLFGYFGLAFGYARYLDSGIAETDRQIKSQSQQIPEEERGNIVNFFSQLSNLRTILEKHVNASSLFDLLERTTHANVHYTRLTLNSEKNEVLLTGLSTSVSDVTEEVKIFQSQPEVLKISLGNIVSTGGGWQFDVTLGLAPSFLVSAGGMNGGVSPSAPSPAPTSTATSTPIQ